MPLLKAGAACAVASHYNIYLVPGNNLLAQVILQVGPGLLDCCWGACGIMLVMRKVAELAFAELVLSADGQLWPLSKPEPE
jgi:hypothetical protein